VRLSSACALAPVNERRFQNWRETRRPVELRSNLREVPTLVRDLVVEVGNALRVGGGGEILRSGCHTMNNFRGLLLRGKDRSNAGEKLIGTGGLDEKSYRSRRRRFPAHNSIVVCTQDNDPRRR
jgi:hypothetical protein